MPLIIASGKTTVSSGGLPVLTLDTRGATVIYIFGSSVFGVAEPLPLHYDDQGNHYTLMSNPFSTCNGGMNGLRCFNPNTSATHTFRVGGNVSFWTDLIVLAIAPDFAGDSFVHKRERSGQIDPVMPGSLPTSVPNYVMVSGVVIGCGSGGMGIDSGFTIIQQTLHMGVALAVQALPTTIDLTWTGLLAVPGQPNPTAGVVVEGFGTFSNTPPPTGSNTRIYEA
jgi:hypothetical protein